MRRILKKALQIGITPANFFCWICQHVSLFTSSLLGCIALRIKAKIFGIQLGKKIKASGNVILLRWPGGKIVIHDSVKLVSGVRRATACAPAFPLRLRVFGAGAEINIGEGSELTAVSITARSCAINIGKNVMIAPNCIITDSDFHAHWPCEQRSVNPGYELDAPVEIADFAWIGMNCIILKGVRIGKGAIIGAGSIVTRDVPDYCVACGNPARITSSHLSEKASLNHG